jgi:hypothetical protein
MVEEKKTRNELAVVIKAKELCGYVIPVTEINCGLT